MLKTFKLIPPIGKATTFGIKKVMINIIDNPYFMFLKHKINSSKIKKNEIEYNISNTKVHLE